MATSCFSVVNEKQNLKQQLTQRCNYRSSVLKNFAKFTGKHLCQSFFFNKVASLDLKKKLWHSCFPVILANFLGTAFFIEHLR